MKKLLLGMILPLIAAGQIDPTIPLRGNPPRINSPLDTALRIQQIRAQQQEAELLRQQAEALRKQNEEHARQLATPPAQPSQPRQEEPDAPIGKEIYTFGFLNGRAWNSLTPGERVIFIVAACESLAATSSESIKQYCQKDLSPNEIKLAIDRFYVEPENLLLRVVDAVKIIAMRIAGVPAAEIENELSLNRRVSGAAPERNK